ncbi:MAG: leucine-rich repeat domain-containing protein [Ruminococcus sp.]|nr:leucine-rich repeat domain-containing protein [Ruminococcus sp.]
MTEYDIQEITFKIERKYFTSLSDSDLNFITKAVHFYYENTKMQFIDNKIIETHLYTFELKKNKTLEIIKAHIPRSSGYKKIHIPSKFNKYRITSIGVGAFRHCDVSEIFIPDTITEIKAAAFEYSNIIRIKLPNKLKSINASTFFCCDKLVSIKIPEGVTAIGNEAFKDCDILKKLILPLSLKKIGSKAFSHCSNFEKFVIPDGVNYIGFDAFEYCHNLKTLILPEGLTELNDIFGYPPHISEITIPDSVKKIKWLPYSIIIKCHKKSYAHKYAKRRFRKYELI